MVHHPFFFRCHPLHDTVHQSFRIFLRKHLSHLLSLRIGRICTNSLHIFPNSFLASLHFPDFFRYYNFRTFLTNAFAADKPDTRSSANDNNFFILQANSFTQFFMLRNIYLTIGQVNFDFTSLSFLLLRILL